MKKREEDLDPDIPTMTVADTDERVLQAMLTLQRMVLMHPEASRAAFAALAREGQRFAQTEDGRKWKERLRRSPVVARAHLVMQTATLFTLDDEPAGATPSAVVDAVAAAARSPHRDALIDRLLRMAEEDLDRA